MNTQGAEPFRHIKSRFHFGDKKVYLVYFIFHRNPRHQFEHLHMSTARDGQVTMADNIESTPGTFLLVDTRSEIRTNHAHGTGADKDIVLVPAPSSHPDDPLNWSPRRKKLSSLCMAA